MSMQPNDPIEVANFRGLIMMWPGATAPDQWAICDGSAINRTTYADLFAIIGETYGVGDGSTTFNLPDMRGRVTVGKSGDTEFDALGKTGGEKAHALSVAELASHHHGNNAIIASGTGTKTTAPISDTTSTPLDDGNENTTDTGSGTAHNNIQPYITINYIIKL